MSPIGTAGWLTGTLVAVVCAAPALAQPAATIVPVEWPRPIYPQIAQTARVQGQVEVAIDVRPDGSVAAVEVVRGIPLLDHAVTDAARRARFECRDCVDAVNRYSLYVTFRLQDPPAGPAPLIISPTQGWVTVVAIAATHRRRPRSHRWRRPRERHQVLVPLALRSASATRARRRLPMAVALRPHV